MISLGFTGTRDGMTIQQRWKVVDLLKSFDFYEVHHGDCVGSDNQFHEIVREHFPNIPIVIHPPIVSTLRAWCTGDIWLPEARYIDRNHDIVNASQVIIATPNGTETPNKHGGGTWSTVRYAQRRKVPVYVILPDGEVEIKK